jgi:hypothetical protein
MSNQIHQKNKIEKRLQIIIKEIKFTAEILKQEILYVFKRYQ